MKSRTSTWNRLIVAVLGLAVGASVASAQIVAVGVDTTTGGDWRTAAALETDNEYGTDGYLLYGINEVDNKYKSTYDYGSDENTLPAGDRKSVV